MLGCMTGRFRLHGKGQPPRGLLAGGGEGMPGGMDRYSWNSFRISILSPELAMGTVNGTNEIKAPRILVG